MNRKMRNPKKTIKFNPLDDIADQKVSPKITPKRIGKPELLGSKSLSKTINDITKQMVSYQMQDSQLTGSSELLFNGTHYGFEIPDDGFVVIHGKDLKSQLKRPFIMSQALGGFITGGPLGFLFSLLAGEPKPNKYFFSFKSNQGSIILISLDRLAVDSIM